MIGICFDDLQVGDRVTVGPYEVTTDEMLEFNRRWDPLPIHVDEEAARRAGHRGVIASGQYTLCIKQHFITMMEWRDAVIGALGFDELRFRSPVHGGDRLTMTIECVDKRESRSNPDRGIAKFKMVMNNQHGEPVLTYIDVVMLRRSA
jgi:acyl dehydratase